MTIRKNMNNYATFTEEDGTSDLPDVINGPRITSVGTPTAGQSYEEFFGGTVVCHTCKGAGRIPREQENELVALIPFNDKRLKPRRTVLYVALAIASCLVVAGLLLFFLLPRSVLLLSNQPTLKPKDVFINTTQSIVSLSIQNEYNISNQNFFSISVLKMSVTVLFDQKVLSTSENHTNEVIPMRSMKPYYVTSNVTFNGEEGYLAYYCSRKSKYGHTLLLPFEVVMLSSYFGHTEETTLTTYQLVVCSKSDTITER